MESIFQERKPNILLVHGALADGSSWLPVIEHLQRDGFNVVASQMHFTSLADDVKVVKRDLGALGGPTVVVGHSYGGLVITEAASEAGNVASLVYISGGAFDRGESIASVLLRFPVPAAAFIEPVALLEIPPFLILRRDKIPEFFCPDIDPVKARAVAATEAPISSNLLTAGIRGRPAWKDFPTWYLITTDDQIIRPDAQRMMADRAAPPERIDSIKSSHASLLSHPAEVANFIKRAATDPSRGLSTGGAQQGRLPR